MSDFYTPCDCFSLSIMSLRSVCVAACKLTPLHLIMAFGGDGLCLGSNLTQTRHVQLDHEFISAALFFLLLNDGSLYLLIYY